MLTYQSFPAPCASAKLRSSRFALAKILDLELPWIIAATKNALVLLFAAAALFPLVSVAQAAPQVWTTNVVPGEFPSRQAALAAVRAEGGHYALAEREEESYQTLQGTSYWYGAVPRNPVIGDWATYTVGGAGGPFPTEEAALQGALNWWINHTGGGPYCSAPQVSIHTNWWDWRWWYDGTAYEQSAIFEVRWGGTPVNGQCYVQAWRPQAWRSRPIQCPEDTVWSSTEKACVHPHIAMISTKPILDCSASPAPSNLVHNPCNIATGGKYQREIDFDLPWIKFFRHYHSSHPAPGAALSEGWTHDLNVRLYPHGGQGAGLLLPEGNILPFRGQSEAVDGSDWRLYSVNSGSVRYEARHPSRTYSFNVSGRLLKLDNLDGTSISLAYDSFGRLESALHSSGRRLEFVYQDTKPAVGAKLASIRSGGVALVSYNYDGNGRLSAAMYPGSSRTYHYENVDFPSHLTGITDEVGTRFSTYQYNTDGLLIASEHAGGLNGATFDYLPDGSATYTDPNSFTKTYTFTADGAYRKIAGIQDASGTQTVTYRTPSQDFRRRPLTSADPRGTVTSYGFVDTVDPESGITLRVETRTEAVGTASQRVTQDSIDPASARLLKRVQDGTIRITNDYNSRGQLTSRTEVDLSTNETRVSTTTYCEQDGIDAAACPLLGLITAADGPRQDVSNIATYSYRMADEASCSVAPETCPYRKGDLWKVTDALGNVTETLRYHGTGRPLSILDSNGVVTDYEYHPRGWLTATKVRGSDDGSETDDRITQIEYWPTGLVKKVIQPDGAFTTYGYDAAHRLTAIGDNAGNTITYALDNAGNRIREDTRDDGGTLRRTLSRIYNQLGQLATQADAGDNPTDFTYDPNGNLKTVTDPLEWVTSNDYDPLNRLVRTLQDVGGIEAETTFEYDVFDHLTKVTDPKGLETGYTYNAFGDLLQLDSPDTGTTTYTYDSAGNRTSQVDARGVISSYAYDALNRLTSIIHDNGEPGGGGQNVAYVYDTVQPACETGETFAVGRLSAMADASGSTQYCYDRFGQLVRKVQVTNGQTFTLRYAYTRSGQLSTLTYPDGTVVDYVRDAQGRVAEVGVTGIEPRGGRGVLLTNAGYAPFGPATGWTYGNGRTLNRTHDLDYRPESILDGAAGGLDFGYSYDPVGNLTALRTADLAKPPRARFEYDALSRLTAFKDGAAGTAIESYAYDATGNRTGFTNAGGSQSYAYSTDSHRLTSIAGVQRTYDAVGNTTAIGANKEFVYNAANRLSEVKQGGTVTMRYVYNGRGERVRRHLGANDVTTVYDEAGRWLGDYDATGTPIQQAIWLDDNPVGLLVGTAGANRLRYVQPDHLGTPRSVIDPIRNVAVWSWDLASEAFGNSPPNQDPDNDGTGFVFDMRFPGQRYDAASGLNYNYFRDYEPGTGRYPQSDPIGIYGGLSTFSYAYNRPLTLIDPRGLVGLSAVLPWLGTGGGSATAGGAAVSPVGAVVGAGAIGLATGTLLYPHIASPLGNAIDAMCMDNPNFCFERWDLESRKCVIWASLGPRWVKACRDRARYRFQLCYQNGGEDPDEPPEWQPSNDYPY